MKRCLVIMMFLLSLGGSAAAQNIEGYWFGGLLIERERLNPMDIFSLTQQNHNFGTARSMAMAGAFTSLGADMSSMSLNPAGLGMYRHSELSLTPLMTFERSSNSAAANQSNHANRFSVGNIGVVFKAYEGTGSLVALNIGIGYNRLADYNSNYSFKSLGCKNTLADVLAQQLNESGIYLDDNDHIFDGFGSDFNLRSELWGGVLGYKSRLLDYKKAYGSTYIWGLDEYPFPFTTDQYTSIRSRGSAGEYTLSTGMNFGNKFYIGATLGIIRIHRSQTITYGENIFAAEDAVPPMSDDHTLQYFDYSQFREVRGSGVDFKIGMTWRPVESLRIGVAYHTPTYYSLNFSYSAGMDSMSESTSNGPGKRSYENWYTPSIDDNGPDSWEYASPSRLLFGASYTFGSVAVVSVDYERDWYNGIRMKYMPSGFDKGYYDDYFRTAFKGSNTLRIGVEVKPTPRLSLRAGYGFNASMLRNEATGDAADALYMTPVTRRVDLWSLGMGFAISPRVTLDVAYQQATSRSSSYSTFYAYAYDYDYRIDWDSSSYSASYATKFKRHNLAMTMTVRF